MRRMYRYSIYYKILKGENMRKTILLSIVVLLVTLDSAPAATRLIPAQYITIQHAIDVSVDGDVIIISPGIYTGEGNHDIDFKGKSIRVVSTNPDDPDVVAATVINCHGTESEPHRGFYFHNNEGPNSVLAGLTITNGFGPVEDVQQIVSAGGAIFCEYSNPTIALCKIEGNYAYKGAGMCNSYSNPTIDNCAFRANTAKISPPSGGGPGGGLFNYYSDPDVNISTFNENWAQYGGGMYNFGSNPTVTSCTFSDNFASYSGGGIYNRKEGSPTVRNCKFIGNFAGSTGGGMNNFEDSNPVVANCLFSGNSANGEGGGMYNCSHYNGPAIYPTIVNCTFSGNFALMDGGGIYDRRQANPILINCILWGNSDSSGTDESAQIQKSDNGTPVVNYCCVQGWTGILGGLGNIGVDPIFVHPTTGNYHLSPNSPCINAGDPDYVPEPGDTDIDGDPRVMDGRIDIGFDEFILTSEPLIGISPTEFEIYADVGGANPENKILNIHNMGGGGTLYWTVAEDCPWLDVNPESGDSTGEIDEVTLMVDISGMSTGLYIYELTITAEGIANSPQTVRIILHILDNDGLLHVPSEYGIIQVAIDTAVDGQTVILAPMTYTGYGNRDLDFGGKAITVRSENPKDPVVVASTVIDCQGSEANPHRGFRFHSGEVSDSVIAGLTITNGFGQHEHVGYTYASAGGAIFCVRSNPTISQCRIQGNEAGHMGGGLHNEWSNSTITNCTFSGNSATYGGGVYNINSHPTVTGCTFSGNSVQGSVSLGGGMGNSSSSPTITNCTFIDNSSDSLGGGMYCSESKPILKNCRFSRNSANYGGGINNSWNSRPVITNCTFSGNSAIEQGGGIQSSTGAHPTLNNCIVWGNEVETALEIWGSATISYSNVEGGWPGEGNIDVNPYLVDPFGDDYHLLFDSPCIDAGNPNYVAEPNETDLDGKPRVIGCRIDMGAYEYGQLVPVEVRIVPRTITLASKGKWLSCSIWPPENYNVADIDSDSILLRCEIEPEQFSVDEQAQVATARFNREELRGIISTGEVELTITGQLSDGILFEGTDIIKVVDRGGGKN
jgi:predicted outer membrane repeat protein